MTPEQLKQFIVANDKTTKEAIEKYVNGGIRALDNKLNLHINVTKEQWEAQSVFMEKMLPVTESLTFIQILVKGTKYLGIPFAAVLAWLIASK